MARESLVLAEVEGKPATVLAGGVVAPDYFGNARLQLQPTRLVLTARHTIAEDNAELLLSEVESVSYLVRGNPLFLIFGILTAGLCVGVFLVVVYFFLKYRYIVVRGRNTVLAIGVVGEEAPYLAFMQAVLAQVEKVKGTANQSASFGSVAARPATAPLALPGGGMTIACPACGAEYKLPKGSAGKKFRCTQCKGVVQAPEQEPV